MIFITIKKITVRDGATVGKWQPVLWLNTGITANTVYRSKQTVFVCAIICKCSGNKNTTLEYNSTDKHNFL